MVVIRPIPKALLIHSVDWIPAESITKDRWGKAGEVSGQAVSRVRMEPSDRIVRDKNNAEIRLAAVLFYDCHNSRPAGMLPAVDDIVTFNGQKFRVQTVDPLYDGRRLHHYEIGLIRYA